MTEANEDEASQRRGPSHENLAAGLIGNVMEWYDFALFGYLAPVISTLFFPVGAQSSSLVATFAIFAAGFLVRPIGGAIFGYIGDKKGRRLTLLLSIFMMTLATSLLGVLPTDQEAGILAVVFLTLLRVVQGLSVGGEFSGSVTYVIEESEDDRRGMFGSLANVGSMSGMVIGSGMAMAATYFLSPPISMPSDGGYHS